MTWKANLAEKSNSDPIINTAEIGQIFSNVAAIYECNKNFLGELTERMENLNNFTLIGDIFIKYVITRNTKYKKQKY